MKSILITGGCGYTGTVLVNSLISLGNKVTVVDTQWFGNYLKSKKNTSPDGRFIAWTLTKSLAAISAKTLLTNGRATPDHSSWPEVSAESGLVFDASCTNWRAWFSKRIAVLCLS